MGLFFLVFLYIVYKAMTYDMEKLHDKRFNEYWDEIEQASGASEDHQQRQRTSPKSRRAFGLSRFTIAAIILTIAVLGLIIIYYEPA